MDKNRLKAYAPGAREKFIKAVSERAAFYGISETGAELCAIKGDFAFIAGRSLPKSIDKPRTELLDKIKRQGFAQVIEEVSYTWFNRIAAIRFMEVNGYLSHGYRILSHPEGHAEPEMLSKAQFLERFGGLEKEEILQLKMAGNKDNELYRKLLIAQCNELSQAMPFLFERVDDLTELLLPDSLLNTDSVIRDMVSEIPEEDWKEVEIIGWLYQFYISEKKDRLMKAKKAYKTEDIPAVTQIFTPNWIVKYMVQNSLGAKWLGTYPKSTLKAKMEYYIEPAVQDDNVKANLKEIIPLALNPEELTVMDPACGSGHILVEAYNLLKEIYLERGYRGRDIPGLILTKNLFGLEIDERAAQLAGFALVMKAYADDREIFEKGVKPNIVCLEESNKIKIDDICRNIESAYTGKLSNFTKDKLAFMDEIDTPLFAKAKTENGKHQESDETLNNVRMLLELFQDAKTFGSLIRIPDELRKKLPELFQQLNKKSKAEDWMVKSAILEVLPFVRRAEIMSNRYDCVIANPPYMGGKGMNGTLKEFAKTQYPQAKSDLFTMFMERGFDMAKDKVGYNSMVTMQNWMFLSSYEVFRENLLEKYTILNLIQLPYDGKSPTAMGINFGVAVFISQNHRIKHYIASFSCSRYFELNENGMPLEFPTRNERLCQTNVDDFKKIPGSPIAYWVSDRIRNAFSGRCLLSSVAMPRQGLATGENQRFVRAWQEVSQGKTMLDCRSIHDSVQSRKKWFPYNKGGDFRKWWGNHDFVIDWQNDGNAIRNFKDEDGKLRSVTRNPGTYFQPSVSWSKITSALPAFRLFPGGFIYDVAGTSIFASGEDQLFEIAGFTNSYVTRRLLETISPTLNFEVGHIASLPFNFNGINKEGLNNIETIINIAKADWNSFETSWDFIDSPILRMKKNALVDAYRNYMTQCRKIVAEMKLLEEENNRIFIEVYGMQDELAHELPIEEITLFANPKYRYKGELTDDDLEARFKADTMKELLSYAVGCMMGRYSLDVPGLVYAHAENKGFDPKKYETFHADEDGILPISEREWFDDDAACRFLKFVETAWNKKSLEENLDFIAGAIYGKSGGPSREAIRRYFANDFFKDHCQVYKHRPIYWLFTSGEEKAFQALVYLHRYNEGTLARMRTEYVLPLQTKISRHVEHLMKDKDVAGSASAGNKIQKEIDSLQKQSKELKGFDELLRNYADKKIKIDLDDGVKVNYGKFGDLLENVKKIAGTDKDEQREDSE